MRSTKNAQQLIIILVTLSLGACYNKKGENQLTEIEKYIIQTDSLTSNSKLYDQLANQILENRPEFEFDTVVVTPGNSSGQLKELVLKFYYDTTGNYQFLNHRIRFKEYNSDKQAAIEFWRIIELEACCIPNEDLVKLKNFENLSHFKNGASMTLLTDNIIMEVELGDKTEINKEISELLNDILIDRQYMKLEIGHGGPAVWTRE